jgi:hypothetical protein
MARAKSARAKSAVEKEEVMEFVEQPLSYEEARVGVSRFEQTYKMPSEKVFSGHSDAYLNISSDVLFEWKSYYDFVSEVDRRLAARLRERQHVEEVVYSSGSGSQTFPRSSEQRKQASLWIAA